MTRYCWDSCVFIDRIQRTPGRVDVLEAITDAAEAHDVEIVTSTLTIAEVCKLSGSSHTLPEQEKLIRLFFENEFIFLIQVTRSIAEAAAGFSRIKTSLKPPDAIHIATAIQAKVSVLQTYDGAFGSSGKMIGYSGLFGDPGMLIAAPSLTGTPPRLFGGPDPSKSPSKTPPGGRYLPEF